MAKKAQVRPNPKQGETVAAKKAVPQEKKITKRITKKETVGRKPNPKVAAPKPLKNEATPSAKNYFTVYEDNIIVEHIKKSADKTKFEVAKELAAKLNRGVEAIRDRIKRYLAKLSIPDQKDLAKVAKASPKNFAYFKKHPDGTRKIEKFSPQQPSLQNREIKRKNQPTGGKKGAKTVAPKKRQNEQRFGWLAQKLKDKDPYFRLDFSVNILTDVFNYLITEHGVAQEDVERLVNQTFFTLSLDEILQQLNVKKANQ